MVANKKKVNNDIGKHCDLLISDFFNFYEQHVDKVMLIDIRDIREPMPPDKHQMRKMMARCQKAWEVYCNYAHLPMASKKLFKIRLQKEWQRRAAMVQHASPEKKQNAER